MAAFDVRCVSGSRRRRASGAASVSARRSRSSRRVRHGLQYVCDAWPVPWLRSPEALDDVPPVRPCVAARRCGMKRAATTAGGDDRHGPRRAAARPRRSAQCKESVKNLTASGFGDVDFWALLVAMLRRRPSFGIVRHTCRAASSISPSLFSHEPYEKRILHPGPYPVRGGGTGVYT